MKKVIIVGIGVIISAAFILVIGFLSLPNQEWPVVVKVVAVVLAGFAVHILMLLAKKMFHQIEWGKEYVYFGQSDNNKLRLALFSGREGEIVKDEEYSNPGMQIDTSKLQVNKVYSFKKTDSGIETMQLVHCAFADLAGVDCPVIAK